MHGFITVSHIEPSLWIQEKQCEVLYSVYPECKQVAKQTDMLTDVEVDVYEIFFFFFYFSRYLDVFFESRLCALGSKRLQFLTRNSVFSFYVQRVCKIATVQLASCQ